MGKPSPEASALICGDQRLELSERNHRTVPPTGKVRLWDGEVKARAHLMVRGGLWDGASPRGLRLVEHQDKGMVQLLILEMSCGREVCVHVRVSVHGGVRVCAGIHCGLSF